MPSIAHPGGDRLSLSPHHPHTTLCLDRILTVNRHLITPEPPSTPAVFLSLNDHLDLFSHDPAAFRRLADACEFAADQLEGAIRATSHSPASKEPVHAQV